MLMGGVSLASADCLLSARYMGNEIHQMTLPTNPPAVTCESEDFSIEACRILSTIRETETGTAKEELSIPMDIYEDGVLKINGSCNPAPGEIMGWTYTAP